MVACFRINQPRRRLAFFLGSELIANLEILLRENVIVIFPLLPTFALAFSSCDPAVPILPACGTLQDLDILSCGDINFMRAPFSVVSTLSSPPGLDTQGLQTHMRKEEKAQGPPPSSRGL